MPSARVKKEKRIRIAVDLSEGVVGVLDDIAKHNKATRKQTLERLLEKAIAAGFWDAKDAAKR